MPGLRAQRRKAQHKLEEAQEDWRDAKPGDRREKLRRRIQFFKNRIRKLSRRIRRKPVADWGWHEPVLGELGEAVVAKANGLGLVVTATTDGQHAAGSYHYQRRAIDFGVDWSHPPRDVRGAEITLQRWLASNYTNAREIFGPDSFYIKNGARYTGMFPGHGDHDHFAW